MNKKIIIVDGHDASGKTSIAHRIAEHYNMKYVKPFSDSLGNLIAWACKNEKYEMANKVALLAIEKIMNENRGQGLVFDRHWMSMYTVLPKEYYFEWERPFTICCWADVETTLKRLSERNENDEDDWNHTEYCTLYKELADKYKVKLIDTSTNSDIDYNMSLIYKYLEE